MNVDATLAAIPMPMPKQLCVHDEHDAAKREEKEGGWAQNWDHQREMSWQNIEAVRALLGIQNV